MNDGLEKAGIHYSHCYQGEYEHSCKYGDKDCPEKILYEQNFTELEIKVMKNIIQDLYAEPGFSDIFPEDLQKEVEIPMSSLRGVLASLVKKGVIDVTLISGLDNPNQHIIYLDSDFYFLHPDQGWKEECTGKKD